jgi:hypothetical protein
MKDYNPKSEHSFQSSNSEIMVDIAAFALENGEKILEKHDALFGSNHDLEKGFFLTKKALSEKNLECMPAIIKVLSIMAVSAAKDFESEQALLIEGVLSVAECVSSALEGSEDETFYYCNLVAFCLRDDSIDIKKEQERIILEHHQKSPSGTITEASLIAFRQAGLGGRE